MQLGLRGLRHPRKNSLAVGGFEHGGFGEAEASASRSLHALPRELLGDFDHAPPLRASRRPSQLGRVDFGWATTDLRCARAAAFARC